MLFGHLAVSILIHRYLETDLAPTVAGGLFPDALDKTLCQVLHVTPSGRTYGHTLLSWGASTLAVRVALGRRTARAWALGYAGHLFGDLPGFVPWLFPFVGYSFPARSSSLGEIVRKALEHPSKIGLEYVLLLWAVSVLLARRKRMRSGSRDVPA
jgi:hypothetical protein